MDPSANPFAALSLIVAPARGPRRARLRGGVGAILTDASAVLAMSTSNRLARAVDSALARATPRHP